jgi:hypothetical protein
MWLLHVLTEVDNRFPAQGLLEKRYDMAQAEEGDGICIAHLSSPRLIAKNWTQAKKMHFLPVHFLLDASISKNRNVFQDAASNGLHHGQKIPHIQTPHDRMTHMQRNHLLNWRLYATL